MGSYIKIFEGWKRVKEAYIKTAQYFDLTTLTLIPEQWKKAQEIWLNIGGQWKKVFPEVITPVTESQVELTSSTAAASGRTILTGKYYHWIDGDTITYYFEKSDDVTPTFSSISSAVVVNPNVGTSSNVSYTVTQADVTVNMDNEYRFHVNAVNAETGGSADSYNTSATNVTINAPRDISDLTPYADASGTSVTVYWTAGAYNQSFKVEYKLSTDLSYTNWNHYDLIGGNQVAIITGLTPGSTYDIQVTPYSGVRVDSTSSKGYYGNSDSVSVLMPTPPPPPGDVTNGLVYLSPTLTNGTTANISQIEGYGNSSYVIVTVNVEDFVKDKSYVTVSGATGSQSVINGSWFTAHHPDRSKFYLYNPSGTWGSITTQNYSSGCTALYKYRTTPYIVTLYWTPGANTTQYQFVRQRLNTGASEIIFLSGAVSSYSFTTINGASNLKNDYYRVYITPYNGATSGNTYYFYTTGAESLTYGDIAASTESAVNTVGASFVKISGYGTSSSPWQGDTYALAPGQWRVNGDASASVEVYLRDWAVDTGSDYLLYSGYADYYVFSAPPFGIPSFVNYQIPSNSVYGSPIYMASVVANDSTLDHAFPSDQGLGTYSYAQTGNVNRLRGPGFLGPAPTAEVTASKTTTNLVFNVYQNTPNPPYWAYFIYENTPAVTGGNGVFNSILKASSTSMSSASNPAILGQFPNLYASLTPSTWNYVTIYGYNNGVFSLEYFDSLTYTKATALPSTPTTSEFYMERSGNTLYWWKIADNYTNVHLIWIRIDRYVSGIYQTSYNYYFYPYFYTVTSNLAGYPNNPSTSIRYSIDISSLPSGTYYPFVGFYNYDFGFGPGPVQATYVGTTYPFTK